MDNIYGYDWWLGLNPSSLDLHGLNMTLLAYIYAFINQKRARPHNQFIVTTVWERPGFSLSYSWDVILQAKTWHIVVCLGCCTPVRKFMGLRKW